MQMREKVKAVIENTRIIPIIRTKNARSVIPVCQALLKGGINVVELTMTIPGAVEKLREISAQAGEGVIIGMGSVLDAKMAESAIVAGAHFIVSPITKLEVINVARSAGCVCVSGAYTPTEAQLAYEAGADYVKIFPADTLGAQYIKAILAPMPHLKLIPTGGVTLENINTFFEAGAVAVGVGSSLVSKKILETEDWEALTKLASEYARAVQKR